MWFERAEWSCVTTEISGHLRMEPEAMKLKEKAIFAEQHTYFYDKQSPSLVFQIKYLSFVLQSKSCWRPTFQQSTGIGLVVLKWNNGCFWMASLYGQKTPIWQGLIGQTLGSMSHIKHGLIPLLVLLFMLSIRMLAVCNWVIPPYIV